MKNVYRRICISGTMLALVLGGLSLQACKSSEKLATRVAIQYAVGKYIERQTPAARVEKAQRIFAAVATIEELAGSDSTTVDALRAYIAQRLDHLSPADRLAVGTIIDLASEVLKERVGDGVLDGDKLVKVREVLAWVSEAASAYAPPATP
jgi:hypothetical protein